MRSYLEYRVSHLERLALEYRVRKLESLLLEGKRDQEILNNFLGDEYYNKYQAIKNKIRDPEYKDIYKLIKKDPDEVKNYIDSFQSNTDIRRSRKQEGAELIYQDDLWKVYRITTYKAAQLYGSGTTWCITGRYDGHEERGEEYFNDYIEENDLDGGYYFYIKNDGKTKFCLLRCENGEVHSIWNAEDDQVDVDNIALEDRDFPTVPGIFKPLSYEDIKINLFSDNSTAVKAALNRGDDVNQVCTDKDRDYYGFTPLEWHYRIRNMPMVYLLMDNGAKITKKMPWQNLFKFLSYTDASKFIRAGIADIQNVSLEEMLEFAMNNSGMDHLKLLLKLGADPTKPFSDGKSALYHEITNRYGARLGAIRELYRYGADINEVLDDGETLLDLAKRTPGANKKPILNFLDYTINGNN